MGTSQPAILGLPEENMILQGSWNYLFWRDETMQIYGKFEGIPF